jgi:hypothetical protein
VQRILFSRAALVSLVVLAACSGQHAATMLPDGTSQITYYKDVQPIVDAKCTGCHYPEGIGPFALLTAEDVVSHAAMIRPAVSAKVMPPWPPDSACSSYLADRSLSDAQIKTITDWIDAGTPLGDQTTQVTAPAPAGLSRVDYSMQMPEPFTPNQSPDDYRCFLLDWMPATTTYVTGLGVRPGDARIVHHAIAFIAPPSQVAKYQMLDANDAGPGWTCFGGSGLGNNAAWLGAWAPGTLGSDFPAGTGVRVDAGSKIVLQVHYNTASIMPVPDQTTVDVKVDATVDKPAVVQPFTDPAWLKGGMKIPANAADTMYDFSLDPSPYLALLTSNVLVANQPVTIHSSALHMHTRGTQIRGSIQHADSTEDCLVDIPSWNFNWQGSYGFSSPKTLNPGDKLYLQCHWNNTAANQPYVNGVQVVPTDVNWGETTEDEMCLEILYLTQ